MSVQLCEASPASFARRAAVPIKRQMAALAAPSNEVEEVKMAVHAALRALSIQVDETTLDRALPARSRANAGGSSDRTMLVATTSEDEAAWRSVDADRSRLEIGPQMLFVLSEGAAMAMQRHAPHLMSVLGRIWTTEARGDPRLAAAIAGARAGRYPELYEAADANDAGDLDEATGEVLAALGDPRTDERAWRRLGFMGRAALVEVEPTIAAHWSPGLATANAVRAALDAWLSSTAPPGAIAPLPSAPRAPQALGEALGVVESASHVLDRTRAHAALADILDSVFQGYAVFPGSEDRRLLFDWWLDEVVPASAALRTPPRFGHRVKPNAPRR